MTECNSRNAKSSMDSSSTHSHRKKEMTTGKIFQFRMLNARQQYINVSSRQQVIETDRNGKAWIIMGVMDILPDQTPYRKNQTDGGEQKKRERCFQHALFLLTNNYPTGRKKYYDSSDKVSKQGNRSPAGSEHLYCEQSPEKHPKQVRCQQYNGSHPYSRKILVSTSKITEANRDHPPTDLFCATLQAPYKCRYLP